MVQVNDGYNVSLKTFYNGGREGDLLIVIWHVSEGGRENVKVVENTRYSVAPIKFLLDIIALRGQSIAYYIWLWTSIWNGQKTPTSVSSISPNNNYYIIFTSSFLTQQRTTEKRWFQKRRYSRCSPRCLMFFRELFIFLCVSIYACKYVRYMLAEARRGHWIPWSWSYKWLWVAVWVLGRDPVSRASPLPAPLLPS